MAGSTRFDRVDRDLRSLLTRGREKLRPPRQAVLVSLVRRLPLCDPLDVFERGALISEDRAYWARPDERVAMAGVGAAWTFATDDAAPLQAIRRFWKRVCADPLIDAPDAPIGTGPLLLGGFAFDPARPRTSLWEGFPGGRMLLPRYLVTTTGGASWVTINQVIVPDGGEKPDEIGIQHDLDTLLRAMSAEETAPPSVPARPPETLPVEDLLPATEWQMIVASLVERLRSGDPRKIVLARAGRVRGPAAWRPARLLRFLQKSYPACAIFGVARGSRCFFGASPERLVHLRAGTLRTLALAGSMARGATPEDDQRFANTLLRSTKDRAEHAFVVRAITEALARMCSEVAVAPAPTLLTLPNVRHLATPIEGRVSPGRTILDLVARLHPTPGVGGSPREAALEVIRAEERLDRGWYAGPVGWLDPAGEGEFAVGIRSALLSGNEATLFTGCGIVAASDPAREYAESCWKLRPVLSALEGCGS